MKRTTYLERSRPGEPMKLSNQFARFAGLLTITLLASASGILSVDLYAADQKPVVAQRLFASPEDATKSLQAATAAKDNAALREIFGPEFRELLTGDEVQGANNAQRFAAAMAQSCKPVNEGQDKVTLEVGTNDWPMAIPLVKVDGRSEPRS